MPELELESTVNLGIPLPNASIGARRLRDLQRIKNAIEHIDVILNQANNTNGVTTTELNTAVSSAVSDIRGGVDSSLDNLNKVKAELQLISDLNDDIFTSITALQTVDTTIQSSVTTLNTDVTALQTMFAQIQTTLSSDDSTLDTIQELVNQIKSNTDTLSSLATVTGSNNTITQTLKNKTVESGVFTKGYTEGSFSVNVSGNYTIDLNNGSFQTLTLTDNTTLVFPNATVPGQGLTLLVKQSVGNKLITWPSNVKWPNGTNPTLTSTVNKTDKFVFCSDGALWLGSVGGQNY